MLEWTEVAMLDWAGTHAPYYQVAAGARIAMEAHSPYHASDTNPLARTISMYYLGTVV